MTMGGSRIGKPHSTSHCVLQGTGKSLTLPILLVLQLEPVVRGIVPSCLEEGRCAKRRSLEANR